MTRTLVKCLVWAVCILPYAAMPSVQAQRIQGCSVTGANELPGRPYSGDLNPQVGRQHFDNYAAEENVFLNRMLGIDAALFYMMEDGDPNAYAVNARIPRLLAEEGRVSCCRDGTILLGTKLIMAEFAATYGTGLSLPAILAHEHAHIAQFKYNCPLQGKWRELHADYVAGWYIRYRDQFPGVGSNVYQAMYNFYYKGDYAFNSESHHGTPAERATAFLAGYNNRAYSGITAYRDGIRYLNSRR